MKRLNIISRIILDDLNEDVLRFLKPTEHGHTRELISLQILRAPQHQETVNNWWYAYIIYYDKYAEQ
jgi:hypothetical protein